MFIHELAQRTGVSAKTIRYYEAVGLLPRPQRASNHYRLYTEADVELLRFIVGARRLGYPLGEIAQFLTVQETGSLPCQQVLTSLEVRLNDIERQIADLQTLRRTLQGIQRTAQERPQPEKCDNQCVCHLLMLPPVPEESECNEGNNVMDELECSSDWHGTASGLNAASGQHSPCHETRCADHPTSASLPIDSRQELRHSPWNAIRRGLLLVIACIASPCCSPMIVSLGIALLTGTPLALWLTHHRGWISSGLTVISILSLMLAVRWMLGQQRSFELPAQLRGILHQFVRSSLDQHRAKAGHMEERTMMRDEHEKSQGEQPSPLVCDLTALHATQRKNHFIMIHRISAAVQEIKELPHGYAFRLAEEQITLLQIADFLANERRCCSFFHFTLSIEPEGGAVWLHLTSPDGVKAVLQAVFEASLESQFVTEIA